VMARLKDPVHDLLAATLGPESAAMLDAGSVDDAVMRLNAITAVD